MSSISVGTDGFYLKPFFKFERDWSLMGEKTDFSGDFQRPNLTMRENLGVKSFQQTLISKDYK